MRLTRPKIEVYIPRDSDTPTVVAVENSDLFRFARMKSNGETVDDPLVWQMTLAWLACSRLGLIEKGMPFEVFIDENDIGFGGADEVDPTNPEPTSG